MFASLRKTVWRTHRRRLCAGLALVAYLVAAVGLPLPTAPASAHKAGGQRFPCENHACGCQTAEECWTHCCCFTPEEHWAWARANLVTPPAYAVRPGSEDKAGCCSDPACQKSPSWDDRSHTACCRHKAPDPTKTPSRPVVKGGPRWAFGVEALKCRGLANLWASVGAALAPPPLLRGPRPTSAGRISFTDTLPIVLSSSPPDPPPRSRRA